MHVLDASRAVDVVSSLLKPSQSAAFDEANRRSQAELREQHAARAARPMLSYREACAKRPQIDWSAADLPVPSFTGTRALDAVSLDEIVPYIDWTFFFSAWELKGRFPAILDHQRYGPAARELYGDAQDLLRFITSDNLLTARGVYGFWPAWSDGDDIVLVEDADTSREVVRFPMLRQQHARADGRANQCLADYVAPRTSGRSDFLGAFAVTAGLGVADMVRQYERDHDDYHAIMVKGAGRSARRSVCGISPRAGPPRVGIRQG